MFEIQNSRSISLRNRAQQRSVLLLQISVRFRVQMPRSTMDSDEFWVCPLNILKTTDNTRSASVQNNNLALGYSLIIKAKKRQKIMSSKCYTWDNFEIACNAETSYNPAWQDTMTTKCSASWLGPVSKPLSTKTC